MPVFSAQELLQRHGISYVESRKGKYTTGCPHCSDNYLSVEIKQDGVVWFCQSCQQGNGEKFEQGGGGSGLGPIKAVYDYLDESGNLLFQVLRFEPINGAKQFRQRTSPEQERWSIKGVRIVPFHLPELLEAVGQGQVVFVVEGEKDVLTLARLGVVATSNPMGAKKWRPEFNRLLQGADVVICIDNDAPGREHGQLVAENLIPVARRVRLVDLAQHWPKIEPSDDISDWVDQGGTAEQLWSIIDRLPTLHAEILAEERAKANGQHEPPPRSHEWPAPHPLPDSLLPVDNFDPGLLPDEVRPWVVDVCARMQCPPDYVAVSLMAALGSMIGRKLAIRPLAHDDWAVIANQWALLIGRPGVLKSPAMEEALRPLHRLSAVAEEKLKKEMVAYEVMASVTKLRCEESKKRAAKILSKDRSADVTSLLDAEEQTSPPTLKRYIANDTNVASLGVLLQQNPNGLLVFRDEIVSLLDNLDREEFVSERGFYLTGWAGDSQYTFDRIGRGLHLAIEGVCLSMLGSTQPGRISQYLSRAIRGGRFDDGLIQRFGLMVWPDISEEWKHVDRWPDREAKDGAWKLFERLDGLDWRAVDAKRDRGPDGDEEGLPHLRFGLDAYDLFVEWRTALERRLRSGELHPALEAHLAKYRKLVPGLSLISHLADGLTGPVGVAAVRRAIGWAGYLEAHARRAYGSVTVAAADTAKAILARVRSGHLATEFGSRDVWRPQWSRLTNRDAVQAGLAMLVDYDWLSEHRVETLGRPATIYTVNPKM